MADERVLTPEEEAVRDHVQYAHYDIQQIDALIESANEKGSNAGALGFLAFTAAADRTGRSLNEDFKTRANKAIRIPNVWTYVGTEYKLPPAIRDPDVANPLLHRVGTTSFVLQVDSDTGQKLALKLVKKRFSNRPSMQLATLEALRPGALADWPTWTSGKEFILMSFIEGETLAEAIYEKPEVVREKADAIALKLCGALINARRPHGDLNPANVIVTPSIDSGEFDLRLIDFGVNYILREAIDDPDALVRASAFLAPEAIKTPKASHISDVFAFGAMLLQMLSLRSKASTPVESGGPQILTDGDNDFNVGEGTNASGVDGFQGRDFDERLDEVQVDSPGLAILIDDMLEPDRRLRFGAEQRAENIFPVLEKRLDVELYLRRERLKKRRSSLVGKIAGMLLAIMSGDAPGGIGERLREIKAFEERFPEQIKQPSGSRDLRYLANWALVAYMSHFGVWMAFIYYANKFFELGTLKLALPGLLICLSFSFVAAKYYESIFSELDVRDLGDRARRVNVWMRFCTFYWPAVIVAVYHFAPQAWGIATFYGTGVVAINNYLTWKLARDATTALSNANLKVPTRVEAALENYKGWYELMALYAISMLVFGLLIQRSVLKDVIAYTVIILMINLKLWLYNSSRDAPPVRNTLLRVSQRYRRFLMFQGRNAKSKAMPAAGMAGRGQLRATCER